MGYPFYDTDDLVAGKSGASAGTVFAQHGEAAWRRKEHECLRQLLTEEPTGFVVATGGGLPLFHENISLMNGHGITIWLRDTPEHLLRRAHRSEGRKHLFGDDASFKRAQIETLLKKREPYYAKAQYSLVLTGKSTDASLEALCCIIAAAD